MARMRLKINCFVLPVSLAARLALSFLLALSIGLAGLVLMPAPVRGATITSTGAGGNWNATTSWSPAQIPVAGDIVTIAVGSPITVNVASACASITVTGTLTITNNIALTVSGDVSGAGTITPSGKGSAINVGGNWSFSGTWTTTNRGIITFNGTGDQTVAGANTFRSVTVNKSAGTLFISGSLAIKGGSVTLTAGDINYSGTAQTLLNAAYPNSLTLFGSGAKTMGNAITSIGGNFTLSGTATATTKAALTVSGNLDVGSGTTFATGAGKGYTLSVTGTTSVTGTLTLANKGTKTFTGDVTLNSGGVWNETGIASIDLAGNLTNNATTFTANAGTHTFSGATKVISGSTTTSIANVAVTGTYTNNGTLSVSTALTGAGTLTNSGTGILNLSGAGAGSCAITTLTNAGIINRSAAGTTTTALANFTNTGTINITDSGAITGITNNAGGIVNHSGSSTITSFNNATSTSTLNISTTPTVPTITTLTATVAGNTVNYSGAGTQTVIATTYSNLTLSGSNAKTFPAGTTTVNGILSIESTATTTVTGTLSYGAAATLQYKGSAAQTTNSEFPSTFTGTGGVIINNASGITLGGSKTINYTLTLTSGIVTTGANTLSIASTGSVSGGSSSYVNGNLQKNVATGATSRTFEVGTASYYNPVTVAFGNVSVAGNLTVNSANGEHGNIATSAIDSSASVNAYWTMTQDGSLAFDNYTATFTFVSGEVDGGASTGLFIVGKYTGGWTYPTVGTRTSTTIQTTGLTAFSDFAVGQLNWLSYNDAERTVPDDIFGSPETTGYMRSVNLTSGALYHVTFYDADGGGGGFDDAHKKLVVDGVDGSNLDAQILFTTYMGTSDAGTWHAVVSYIGNIAPDTYDANWANALADHSFTVQADAIPEFSTIFAAIAVAGLCSAIYYWMKKKRLALVEV
ncbi:MAG: hypothetical protein C4542_07715 [Dehalococcoidia bacterium]|nr:MAG: hypothetical protein C4542_07715 [Dehalococcoidia bacterium]